MPSPWIRIFICRDALLVNNDVLRHRCVKTGAIRRFLAWWCAPHWNILLAWYAPNLSDGGRLGAYFCKTAFHFLKWLSVACGLPFTMESTHRQLVAEVTLIGRW